MLCKGDLQLDVAKSPAGTRVHKLTMFPAKKAPGQRKDLDIPFEDDSGQPISIVDAYKHVELLHPSWKESDPMCLVKSKPLSTKALRKIVKQVALLSGEDPNEYGAHSLRIGGATALHAAGCPELVLKSIGRWSSDIFEIYARAEAGQLFHYQSQIGLVDAAPLESTVPGYFI